MRQAQLLECAITAFAQNGIERAVHADVAALSGVSTPTVFKYFATREVLVAAVLGEIERRILSLLARVPTAPQSDPQNRVRALATVVDQLCAQTPDQMKVALSWSVAFTAVRPRYLAFQETCLDLMQQRISDVAEDRTDARILLGAAIALTQMSLDGTDAEVRERFVARLGLMIQAVP